MVAGSAGGRQRSAVSDPEGPAVQTRPVERLLAKLIKEAGGDRQS
jgi:hypothetical protein